MRSEVSGTSTSAVEVTHISRHGIWLLLEEREFFLPFREFPWFKEVPISAVLNVELPQPHHLYWPDMDVDLDVESIEHPERFPLVAKDRNRSRRLARPTATEGSRPHGRTISKIRGVSPPHGGT